MYLLQDRTDTGVLYVCRKCCYPFAYIIFSSNIYHQYFYKTMQHFSI